MASKSKKEPKKPSELIQIIDGYAFEYDKFGFTLYEVGKRRKQDFKTKQLTDEVVEYADVLGYYGTISVMCEACLNFATKKGAENANVKNLSDYIEIMKQIASEIRSAVDITAF